MGTTKDHKLEEFRAESTQLVALMAAKEIAPQHCATSDDNAPIKLGELFNASGSAIYQNARELALNSDAVSGVGGSGVFEQSRVLERHERETAQRNASNDTVLFLELLRTLQDQIRELERQIAKLDEQIEATDSLIDILQNGGEIDPTDPDHQRLLRLAGIPEDQWGTVTLDDLRAHKTQLQIQRDDAKVQLDKKVAEGAAFEVAASNREQGIPTSADTIEPREAVEEYSKRNPAADLDDLSVRDLLEIRKINLVSEYIARSDHAEKDIDWFKAAYAELNLSMSDGSVLGNSIDLLVEQLSENGREALLTESDLDQALIGYLVEDKIKEIEAEYDLSSPDQQIFVEMVLADLSDEAKFAVQQSPSASTELKSIIEIQLGQSDNSVVNEISNPER